MILKFSCVYKGLRDSVVISTAQVERQTEPDACDLASRVVSY